MGIITFVMKYLWDIIAHMYYIFLLPSLYITDLIFFCSSSNQEWSDCLSVCSESDLICLPFINSEDFLFKLNKFYCINEENEDNSDHCLDNSMPSGSENNYLCPTCGKSYNSSQKLRGHFYKVHYIVGKPSYYKCDFCQKSFVRPSVLKKHLIVHNQEKKFECEICNVKFKRKHDMNVHLKKHLLVTDQFKCNICDMSFSKSFNLKRHNDKYHS